jgi:hypothetical protein
VRGVPKKLHWIVETTVARFVPRRLPLRTKHDDHWNLPPPPRRHHSHSSHRRTHDDDLLAETGSAARTPSARRRRPRPRLAAVRPLCSRGATKGNGAASPRPPRERQRGSFGRLSATSLRFARRPSRPKKRRRPKKRASTAAAANRTPIEHDTAPAERAGDKTGQREQQRRVKRLDPLRARTRGHPVGSDRGLD